MKKTMGVCLLAVFFLLVFSPALSAAQDGLVYVIQIKGTVDPGQAKYVERIFQEAEQTDASMVILEVDTPGGRVDAALNIRDAIRHSTVPTTALVKGGAISAGALITVACEKIAMEPGATIGAAEPRIGTEMADEKFVSYFTKEMRATAEVNGRDPEIAEAMVDRDKEIPGLVDKGKLLTLTYLQAKEHGYADYIVQDRAELLGLLGLAGAEVRETGPSMAEQITRTVTNPFIAPVLLTMGIAGIIIEVFTVGWGVAGTVGLVSLALYFGGHLMAGFIGWGAILLFLLGFILLAVEVLMPGFGIPGISGIICLVISIILAAPSWEQGLVSLVFAIVGTIILMLVSFKLLRKRRFWHRLVLDTKYKKEDGYIPQVKDLSQYVGAQGTAFTTLRPAGTVILEDGTRLDVVTDGEYIPQGEKVRVTGVEGARVVVRKAGE